ncbi:MAG: pyroglutamyl-peptidase I [Opitutaceae bacterium]|nr:pyroglutamyl-peptidase I [Opitutaceae bacterium]
MKTVLVTGFEPFGGERRNPSQEIAAALHGRKICGRTIVGAVLPCVFGQSIAELRRHIRRHQPELVIALGQAGGRPDITPERIAINVDDARIADNTGRQPIDRRIVRRGPAAFLSTLPIKAIVAALHERGMAASISNSAGTFVCNHVFYGLMSTLRGRPGVRGGFVHVPFLPEQVKRSEPSLPLRSMIAAIEIAIEVSVTTRRDHRVTGGKTQ